jgi:excisionase family DNA binding protein
MPASHAPDSDLLSLQRASQLLGVHPSTLRVWSDKGKISTIRTAGGHRRFALKEVRMFAERRQSPHEKENAELIVHSALGRARMEVARGGLSAQAWYRRFDEAAREHHRGMGRKLLALMLHYLNAAADPAQAGRILNEAGILGSEYGRAALGEELTLGDAMRAFLYFRDSLLESVVQLRGIAAGPEMDSLTSFRLVNTFTNEMLLAMVAAFQES